MKRWLLAIAALPAGVSAQTYVPAVGGYAQPVINVTCSNGTCVPGGGGGGGGGGGAITVANGADQAQGSTTDTAYSGTGAGTIVSILKAANAGIQGLYQASQSTADGGVVIHDATGANYLTSGNPGFISVTNPVTVGNLPATQPISAASLPLPSGASTSALQTTGNTSAASTATNTGTLAGTVGTLGSTAPGTGQQIAGTGPSGNSRAFAVTTAGVLDSPRVDGSTGTVVTKTNLAANTSTTICPAQANIISEEIFFTTAGVGISLSGGALTSASVGTAAGTSPDLAFNAAGTLYTLPVPSTTAITAYGAAGVVSCIQKLKV